VKAAPFDYVAPRSLGEAVGVLAGDPEAKVLAGGQSLLPLLAMRLSRPTVLVDVNELVPAGIRGPGDGPGLTDAPGLTIGAGTRHALLETSEEVARLTPALAEAAGCIGYPAVRNRGTVGGSLAHADPVAELPAVLSALGADVNVAGARGSRRVPVRDLCVGFLTNGLTSEEIITDVSVPVPPRTGSAWEEYSPRLGDFAICGIGARVTLEADDSLGGVAIGGAGLGTTPVVLELEGPVVAGATTAADVMAVLGPALRDRMAPLSDLRASAEERRHLAPDLIRRAVTRAWQGAASR
jgi:aerobic carbon-monoxide dehydrogenase medium subunit